MTAASSSVVAIWALSGLAIYQFVILIFILIAFMILAAIMWPLLHFARVILSFIRYKT